MAIGTSWLTPEQVKAEQVQKEKKRQEILKAEQQRAEKFLVFKEDDGDRYYPDPAANEIITEMGLFNRPFHVTYIGSRKFNVTEVTSQEIKKLRGKKMSQEEIERLRDMGVSETEIERLSKKQVPSLVIKKDGKLFWTAIDPKSTITWTTTHCCSDGQHDCAKCISKPSSEGGCDKTFNFSCEIEKHDFVILGYETFGTPKDSYIVVVCRDYVDEEHRAPHVPTTKDYFPR